MPEGQEIIVVYDEGLEEDVKKRFKEKFNETLKNTDKSLDLIIPEGWPFPAVTIPFDESDNRTSDFALYAFKGREIVGGLIGCYKILKGFSDTPLSIIVNACPIIKTESALTILRALLHEAMRRGEEKFKHPVKETYFYIHSSFSWFKKVLKELGAHKGAEYAQYIFSRATTTF